MKINPLLNFFSYKIEFVIYIIIDCKPRYKVTFLFEKSQKKYRPGPKRIRPAKKLIRMTQKTTNKF